MLEKVSAVTDSSIYLWFTGINCFLLFFLFRFLWHTKHSLYVESIFFSPRPMFSSLFYYFLNRGTFKWGITEKSWLRNALTTVSTRSTLSFICNVPQHRPAANRILTSPLLSCIVTVNIVNAADATTSRIFHWSFQVVLFKLRINALVATQYSLII